MGTVWSGPRRAESLYTYQPMANLGYRMVKARHIPAYGNAMGIVWSRSRRAESLIHTSPWQRHGYRMVGTEEG
jgi:hypothetical protein